MTPELEQHLSRLEELDKAATKAPWKCQNDSVMDTSTLYLATCVFWRDATLIAESRNALPSLLAALREAVKALEIYANPDRWSWEIIGPRCVSVFHHPEEPEDQVAINALSTIETMLKPTP